MILQLRRGPEALLGDFKSGSRAVEGFVFPEDDNAYEDGTLIDTDKAWHAIHFILSGTVYDAYLPEGFLLGGTEIGDELAYGPARYLNVSEVKKVAQYLQALPEDVIQAQFDYKALHKNDIYPSIWDRTDTADLEYIADYYEEIRDFMLDAAKASEIVVLAMT